jgi:hypothetical protein
LAEGGVNRLLQDPAAPPVAAERGPKQIVSTETPEPQQWPAHLAASIGSPTVNPVNDVNRVNHIPVALPGISHRPMASTIT